MPVVPAATTTTTTTRQADKRPKTTNSKKSPEPTTSPSPFEPRPQNIRPEKLQAQQQSINGNKGGALRLRPIKASAAFKVSPQQQPLKGNRPGYNYLPPTPPPRYAADYKVVTVYQKPKYKYIIDKITQIPGELYAKILSKERLIKSHFQPKPEKIVEYHYSEPIYHSPPPPPPQPTTRYIPIAVMPPKVSTSSTEKAQESGTESPVEVESIGDVDANAVLSDGQTVIILQPSARAVVGKDGTAIANPISRALIRKDVPTTIIYRPHSVAIAGPGGTAHAQAELIVDYVDE